ncbi:TPA: hypothetical protein HA259_01150 [Thermoplasmata archaeon]|nr:hypothetical protein [Thermoplasmata archaeon]
MGSKLEDAAESIDVKAEALTSAVCRSRRRKEWLARILTKRLAVVTAVIAGLTGVVALAANSRASFYPYETLSDTRPGPTTVVPTLVMVLTVLMALGFGVIWNLTRYEDFFGSNTYYGVARIDSGAEGHATPG